MENDNRKELENKYSAIVEDEPAADAKPSKDGKKKGSIAEDSPEVTKKKLTTVLLIVMIVALFACLAYIGAVVYNNVSARKAYGELDSIALNGDTDLIDTDGDGIGDTKLKEGGKVSENAKGFSPVDLPALQKINKDVYAWVRIPGTYVDYPIAQSDIDDNYYLHRSIYKTYLFAGMIYTQSCNSKEFDDPITVVYGHNMRSTTMFSSLMSFRDQKFFKEHEYFYIYTVDRVLTYRIISAYKYDNRHIMNSFDFSNGKVLYNYQQNMLDPKSTVRNVRDGVTLDDSSKVVVLSTCMEGDKSSRFLVNGVLISDVPIE